MAPRPLSAAAVLAGQALSTATRPSVLTYASVLAAMAVLLPLYFLARELTLPVVDHRDAYRGSELLVKAAEVGLLGLAALRLRREKLSLGLTNSRYVQPVTCRRDLRRLRRGGEQSPVPAGGGQHP